MASNFLENKVADHVYRGVSYTAPSTIYVGLATVFGSDSSNGTEVSGNGYARVAVTANTTNWSATNGAGTTTNPSSGTAGIVYNNTTITFPTPTGSWGTVVAFLLMDASTSGNQLNTALLDTPRAISTGDVVTFAPGDIQIQHQ